MDYTDAADLPWLQPSEALTGSDESLAEFFGVTPRTIRTWKKTNRAPLMVLRLMRLRMDGDLSALGGKQWEREAKRLERELNRLRADAWAAGKVREVSGISSIGEARR